MTPRPEESLRSAWPALAVLLLVVGTIASCTTGDAAPPSRTTDVTAVAAERGRQRFLEYGCGACHQVDGLRGADGRVGPRLDDLAEQRIIAGVLANTPGFLAAWIRDPQQYSSDTAMPDVGVTEEDASDIATFLLQPR